MSAKDDVLGFLERHHDSGYTVYELMVEIKASESSIRKSLHQLTDEDLIEVRGGDHIYYGFVGVECDQMDRCDTVVPECRMFAHRCVKREILEDEQLEELNDDEDEE